MLETPMYEGRISRLVFIMIYIIFNYTASISASISYLKNRI